MQIIHLKTEADIEKATKAAAVVIAEGGVILYPTDTLYGLGTDAFNNAAVDTIYKIKGRPEGKPIHVIVKDEAAIQNLGEWNETAAVLAARFLPGPLTLILKKLPRVQGGIARDMTTIGCRIPRHPYCAALTHTSPSPITTTSANKSGQPTLRTVPDILEQLGEAATLIHLVIDAGPLPSVATSTIVDITTSPPTILREGAISIQEIEQALHKS